MLSLRFAINLTKLRWNEVRCLNAGVMFTPSAVASDRDIDRSSVYISTEYRLSTGIGDRYIDQQSVECR